MKLLFKTSIFAIFLVFLAFFPISASAAEQIDNYEIYVKVNQDSELNITEKIQYNFGTDQRHGIFREIPYTIEDKNGQKYLLDISVNEVIHEENRVVPYTESESGENVVLKIGDPNRIITGSNTYIISYRVKGAITYFEEHDELYWDAIGTGWEVPILNANVTLDLSSLEGLTSENTNVI